LLEERLKSRLLQRSTRHFGMTEVGEVYYRHCLAMIAEAEAAQEAIDNTSAEPRGMIRVTCPISLMFSSVTPIISRYLAAHPQVRVQLSATNRRVDVIEEGVDVALRVRFPPLENEGLVMKRLAESRQLLVGSPALLEQLGRPGTPAELSRLPGLDLLRSPPKHAWDASERYCARRLSVAPRAFPGDPQLHRLSCCGIPGLTTVQRPSCVSARVSALYSNAKRSRKARTEGSRPRRDGNTA
jgi:DNA-binding transcriptional LysR family regulator